MKTFKSTAAQGELTIIRIGDLPKSRKRMTDGFTPLQPENGKYIVGHSETGHHHVLSRNDGVDIAVMDRPPEGMRILRAILENPTTLEHLRQHDTHEPIMLEPGEYEIRIAREYDPYAELARQSAD
jgi:6-phosphogluconate dehydrogenase (decarboxylating)